MLVGTCLLLVRSCGRDARVVGGGAFLRARSLAIGRSVARAGNRARAISNAAGKLYAARGASQAGAPADASAGERAGAAQGWSMRDGRVRVGRRGGEVGLVGDSDGERPEWHRRGGGTDDAWGWG